MPTTIFISRRFRLTHPYLLASSSSRKNSEGKKILKQAIHITNLQLHPIKIFAESQLLTQSRYLRISSSYKYLHFKEISINIYIVIIVKQQQHQNERAKNDSQAGIQKMISVIDKKTDEANIVEVSVFGAQLKERFCAEKLCINQKLVMIPCQKCFMCKKMVHMLCNTGWFVEFWGAGVFQVFCSLWWECSMPCNLYRVEEGYQW